MNNNTQYGAVALLCVLPFGILQTILLGFAECVSFINPSDYAHSVCSYHAKRCISADNIAITN